MHVGVVEAYNKSGLLATFRPRERCDVDFVEALEAQAVAGSRRKTKGGTGT